MIADISVAIGQQNTTDEGANLGIRAGFYEQVVQKIRENPKMFADEYRTFFEEAMTTKDIVFDIRPSKDNHKIYYNYQLKDLIIKDIPTQSWGFEYKMSFVEIIEQKVDVESIGQNYKPVITKEGADNITVTEKEVPKEERKTISSGAGI